MHCAVRNGDESSHPSFNNIEANKTHLSHLVWSFSLVCARKWHRKRLSRTRMLRRIVLVSVRGSEVEEEKRRTKTEEMVGEMVKPSAKRLGEFPLSRSCFQLARLTNTTTHASGSLQVLDRNHLSTSSWTGFADRLSGRCAPFLPRMHVQIATELKAIATASRSNRYASTSGSSR